MSSRRQFLKNASLATAGLTIGGHFFSGSGNKALAGPGSVASSTGSSASSYKRIIGSNERVNVAFIGIGNRGWEVLTAFEKTEMANIVALCDVDLRAKHTQNALSAYPQARTFKDFRQLFDQAGTSFDAVVVCTPDHSHFPACMLALAEGKHVYVEKPLTRSFYESELLMAAAARRPGIVTQMGNQGHSDANYFQFRAWQEAGIIKDVTRVTAHMNNPRRWHEWDTGMRRFPLEESIPETLDWDLWLTTAPHHPYNSKFHYGDWRCWYAFGVGVLGDWGAHIIDTVHEFLDLGLPESITPLKLEGHNPYFFPKASTIVYKFPERGQMPALELSWYDGVDNIPEVPAGYGVSELDPNIPSVAGAPIKPAKLNPGKEIYGKDLTFKGGSHGSTLSIIPDEKAKEMEKQLPDVPESPSNHYANFLLACQGKEQTRSPFSIAGPLSQVLSLGVIAQQTGRALKFDRQTKRISDDRFADALLVGPPPRKEWEAFYKI